MAFKPLIKNPEERQIYSKLVETCLCTGSEESYEELSCLQLELSYTFKDFNKHLEAFKEEIGRVPLSVFIATWADIKKEDQTYGVRHMKIMCELIEKKFIPLISLRDFMKTDIFPILEDIRCFEEWTLAKREEMVLLYTSFLSWLAKTTFGYISEIVDPDRAISLGRQVSFETYINILERLDLREQILAKMFYLGGDRGQEEVLSVKIEDIDPKKKCIRFSEEVFYPRHLFEDIKKYTQGRKTGLLFEGRGGERIAYTTPFRALKKVAIDLKLDPEFTFKELTKNI